MKDFTTSRVSELTEGLALLNYLTQRLSLLKKLITYETLDADEEAARVDLSIKEQLNPTRYSFLETLEIGWLNLGDMKAKRSQSTNAWKSDLEEAYECYRSLLTAVSNQIAL